MKEFQVLKQQILHILAQIQHILTGRLINLHNLPDTEHSTSTYIHCNDSDVFDRFLVFFQTIHQILSIFSSCIAYLVWLFSHFPQTELKTFVESSIIAHQTCVYYLINNQLIVCYHRKKKRTVNVYRLRNIRKIPDRKWFFSG